MRERCVYCVVLCFVWVSILHFVIFFVVGYISTDSPSTEQPKKEKKEKETRAGEGRKTPLQVVVVSSQQVR